LTRDSSSTAAAKAVELSSGHLSSETKQVIDAVKARIAQIQPGLPEGVTIVPFYDRSTQDLRYPSRLRFPEYPARSASQHACDHRIHAGHSG